jgi:hypothetical protein
VRARDAQTASSGSSGAPEGQMSAALMASMEVSATGRLDSAVAEGTQPCSVCAPWVGGSYHLQRPRQEAQSQHGAATSAVSRVCSAPHVKPQQRAPRPGPSLTTQPPRIPPPPPQHTQHVTRARPRLRRTWRQTGWWCLTCTATAAT